MTGVVKESSGPCCFTGNRYLDPKSMSNNGPKPIIIAIRAIKVYKIMAFTAVIRGFGLLFFTYFRGLGRTGAKRDLPCLLGAGFWV